MKNSKCLFYILCFWLFALGLGIQNTFAQNDEINDNERFHIGFRFFPNTSTVLYNGMEETGWNLNHYNWGLSSTLGVTVEARLLKRVYLISGIEYANFTEIISRGGEDFSAQFVDPSFLSPTLKNRFGYVTVPLELKLIVVDKAKTDLYMTVGGRGMYNIFSLGITETEDEVSKSKLESNDVHTIVDWVWGGRVSLGIEIPISSTVELFIEPTFEYYPRTNDFRFQNRVGELISVDRRMYTVGLAMGVKF